MCPLFAKCSNYLDIQVDFVLWISARFISDLLLTAATDAAFLAASFTDISPQSLEESARGFYSVVIYRQSKAIIFNEITTSTTETGL